MVCAGVGVRGVRTCRCAWCALVCVEEVTSQSASVEGPSCVAMLYVPMCGSNAICTYGIRG